MKKETEERETQLESERLRKEEVLDFVRRWVAVESFPKDLKKIGEKK
jgi:hypothetical protein